MRAQGPVLPWLVYSTSTSIDSLHSELSHRSGLALVQPSVLQARPSFAQTSMGDAPVPQLDACRVHVHTSTLTLAEQNVPPHWEDNQYAVELWLQRSLHAMHPWRVRLDASPDLIFVLANFSMYCVAGKSYGRRVLWDELLASNVLAPNSSLSRGVPKIMALQYGGCSLPWNGATPAPMRINRRPKDMLLLLDQLERRGQARRSHGIVTPFLVPADPFDAVASRPPRSEWAQRKLLFFAGHVPKLMFSSLRYTLWKAMRTDRRVTALSPTLLCSIGSFVHCGLSDDELHAKPLAFFTTFCHNFSCSVPEQTAQERRLNISTTTRCGFSDKLKLPQARARFRNTCRTYGGRAGAARIAIELPDMRRDTRRLSHHEYILTAMSHRFCLVVEGDFISTHKVTEAMAMGGAGGCIPVFVFDAGGRPGVVHGQRHVANVLPYTRWLDYVWPPMVELEDIAD